MSAIALISKELSSFLAVDLKGMIEALTDLWDSHDIWEYKTSEKGMDKLHNVCVSCFLATTPSWIAANLPEEAIGGGFTSRVVVVSSTERYKSVAIPPPPDEKMKRELINDLNHIAHLQGEFSFSPEAQTHYETWYATLEKVVQQTSDQRLHGFIARIHVMVLKVAMALRVSYSDTLIIDLKDIKRSIAVLQQILETATEALSGHGRSTTSFETQNILKHIKLFGTTTFSELLRLNWHNTDKLTLEAILQTLESARLIRVVNEGKERVISYTPVKQ